MKAPTSARTLRTACIATLLAMIVLLGGFASASAYAATVQGNVFSSSEGQGIPYAEVEIWRQDAGTWGVEDLATCDADGAWSYDTTDTSPVRVRAYDPTAGHKPAWFGGTSVQSATDVIPSDTPDDTNMTLPFVKGGTLGGWAGDSNSGYPIDKIRVTAWLVGVTNPVVHQTTTADDGVFSLPNLPAGSYIVRFDDPTLTWDTQYAFFADVQADATPFEIDGPGSYFCDGFLSRHVSALTLTPTAASSDSTLSPAVGGTITLETTCTDANLGGALRSGMPVQLYASPDGAAWTPQANPVTSPSVGRYRTSIAITSVGKIYYKFAVPAADYRAYVESDPCLVIRRGPTYWSTDLSVVPGQPTNPGPGDATAITAKLVTGDGAPAAGRVVRVQASPWNG
ncbi:MAG: carboxypeptidase-like regulatory domain-containing protein [Coriobacteriia bacterium]|nr:carboxypeptidase-like regulatory domain-containing protein [Coriobacteriia bacterium]